MDWNNLDLSDNSHERDSYLIDPFDFEALFTLINCNIAEINQETVKKEFYEYLNNKVEETKEVFEANLYNIVKQAKKERARK